MKPSQALELVAEHYVPGVVAFFGKQSPDPWMKVHEELEAVMLLHNPAMTEMACEIYVKRCLELIGEFQKQGVPSEGVSVADATVLGPIRNERWHSIKKKQCEICEGKENLSLEPVGPDALQVRIVCGKCRGRKSA